MKKRLLFDEINKQINHKNAIVIIGSRQVGKTTLMKQIFDEIESQSKLWFDFDNPLDQKIFEDIEYKNIYERLLKMVNNKERLFIFIDEIQNYPEITKVIKYFIDHYGVKFIVTGSSSFYLKNLFPESLSGRKFLYQLSPLSFREYLYFRDKMTRDDAMISDIGNIIKNYDYLLSKKLESDYEEYLKFGGFPEVVLTSDNETKKQILKNIFTSFFEKDIQIIADYKDIRELRDLILLLVPRVGSLIDVTRISSELGVSRVKVYSYLEFLEKTFMIRLMPKFSKGIDRSVAGGKKIYFSDTGILNAIGYVNDSQLFENAVVNQLAFFGELSFYNKKNKAEIDVILNKKTSFEIKMSGIEKDYEKLNQLSQSLGIKDFYIISKKNINKSGFISASLF
ncbi:MAG: ATP-binding protein [Candidatus Pacebacteria bacterium]|nr:ATP-binding protein [Candidatus Paceibacterota bacterium]MDD2757529.1 ATP-binding protein [Candidatus Paceibacterota bacterium]MDD3283912.1 ATP-binding protein [Candidatus Paceibacterota bacterium]MDD3970142.1 ATP-binding protein [Candidatus Paceibacterota bacterium]MDD4738166.1 ATP-binding protein [Candidatus Paceibacterota bacterium]